MRFLLGLVLAVRWLSAQDGQEARKNDPPSPPQAPRTDGGLVNAAALRNENVQVNLIDNDGLKEASIRLGDKVTVIPEASRVCEDDLIGGKTGCILKAGLDMLRPELGICSEDELARLSGCALLQNQINGDSSSFETRFTHHHVRSSLNKFRELHHSDCTREIISTPPPAALLKEGTIRLLGTHLGRFGINQLRRAAKARHDFLLGR